MLQVERFENQVILKKIWHQKTLNNYYIYKKIYNKNEYL